MAIRKFAHLVALLGVNLLVHIWLFLFTQQFERVAPMNDVLLYGYWLQQMPIEDVMFGINHDWVYPAPALVPMFVAKFVGGSFGIMVGWVAMMAIANSIALGALVRWGEAGAARFAAGWFWVAFIFALGPVAISRIDAAAAALAVFGVLALAQNRLRTAVTLFTFGAWIKIWPAALLLGTLITEKLKRSILATAAVFSGAVLLIALLLGGNFSVFSFLTTQTNRGIQIESPVAMFWLWAAKLKLPNAGIYFDEQMITNQVSGIYVAEVSALMTLIMVGALGITAWLGLRALKAAANKQTIFTVVALTAVLDLIVFNKVGSPQFMAWLAAPIIAWFVFDLPRPWVPAGFALVIATLTQLVYPILYIELMGLGDSSMIALTVRNLALVVFLVWANLQLSRLARRRVAA